MDTPMGALSGSAGGMADAVAGIIEQRMRQAQLANTIQETQARTEEAQARSAEMTRHNQAEEAYQTANLAENTAYRKQQQDEQQRVHDVSIAGSVEQGLTPGDQISAATGHILDKGFRGDTYKTSPPLTANPIPGGAQVPSITPSPDANPMDALAQPPAAQPAPGVLRTMPSVQPALAPVQPGQVGSREFTGDYKERQAQQKRQDEQTYIDTLPPGPTKEQARFHQQTGGTLQRPAPAAADIVPDIKTTMGGRKYLDLSQFGMTERPGVREAANKNGVVTVSKDEASTLADLDLVRLNQKSILDQIGSKLAPDAQGRFTVGLGNILGKAFQTDDEKAAFGSWRTTAISTLRAMAGSKGLRINQAEIALALQNDIPTLTDTLGTAQQKVKNINTVLDHAEQAILVHDRSTLGGAPSAAPAAGAGAGAGAGTGSALPPSDQRVDGQLYTLGNGRQAVWKKGTGFIDPPASGPPGAAPRPSLATAPVAPATVAPTSVPRPPATVAPAGESRRLALTQQLGALDTEPGRMQLSPAGLASLRTREGGFAYDGTPYQDLGTGLAIGYGMHQWEGKPVMPDQHVTEAQANREMDRQIATIYKPIVDQALKVSVTQPQYDALLSMAWNSPAGARYVIEKLNRGVPLTAEDFQRTATVKGEPHKGLQGRRSEEAAPFLGGTP